MLLGGLESIASIAINGTGKEKKGIVLLQL